MFISAEFHHPSQTVKEIQKKIAENRATLLFDMPFPQEYSGVYCWDFVQILEEALNKRRFQAALENGEDWGYFHQFHKGKNILNQIPELFLAKKMEAIDPRDQERLFDKFQPLIEVKGDYPRWSLKNICVYTPSINTSKYGKDLYLMAGIADLSEQPAGVIYHNYPMKAREK